MSFTAQNVIDDARPTLNDSAKARHTDADGLRYVREGLHALALIRPDLFIVHGEIATTANTVDQDLATAKPNVTKLIAIHSVKNTRGGAHIEECDYRALAFTPTWRQAAAVAEPYNWARHPQDDPKQGSGTKYFLYPRPKADVVIIAEYVEAVTISALSTAIDLSDAYRAPLIHYYIFRAESMEDEYVVTQRAMQSMQVFMQGLGLAKENKIVIREGRPQ